MTFEEWWKDYKHSFTRSGHLTDEAMHEIEAAAYAAWYAAKGVYDNTDYTGIK